MVDTGDIDITWQLEASDATVVIDDWDRSRPRAMMPTLRDEDPVSYYHAYQREDAPRGSMPSLPAYSEPEPSYSEPEPSYCEPEPSYCEPEPSYCEPEPLDIAVVDDDDDVAPDTARTAMATLPDEDPLCYDVAYRREHADSMPTLPDIG